MKVIVAPDKFKGSITSVEVCNAIKAGIHNYNADIDVQIFPMADGGDGFAAVMKYYLQTDTIPCNTVDPLHRAMVASYEWQPNTQTAIIEMAAASGMVLLQAAERNPMHTSTLGTGLLIKHAIANGAKHIILGLGGSATNDVGMGILTALGFTFKDLFGNVLQPTGSSLQLVHSIEVPTHKPDVIFEIACDVNNTLYGPNGAAYVYAAQKGATEHDMVMLDNGLQHMTNIIKQTTGIDVSTMEGGGAAGGIAAGLMPFFNTQLKTGMAFMLQASQVNNALPTADILITGEGKMDAQTLQGKVVQALTQLAKEHNIPTVACCGKIEDEALLIDALALHAVVEISKDVTTAYAMQHAALLLTQKITQLFNSNKLIS
jgi:glycerate 2-kinase